MELRSPKGFEPLDVALARRLCTMASEAHPSWVSGPETFLAVAMVSRAVRLGFVCLDLQSCDLGAFLEQCDIRGPDPETLVNLLLASPLCRRSEEQHPTPLVLDLSAGRPRLYLDRYWRYECMVLEEVKARTAFTPVDFALEPIGELLPDSEPLRNAAMGCTSRRLSLLSTGHGTARVLAATILALLRQYPGLRVRTLAGTGRASATLRQELLDALAPVCPEGADFQVLTGTFFEVVRAAGWHLAEDDVVVVGEASALDIATMARLLERVPRRARLILIGDPYHLASPVCGTVFMDLFAALASTGAAVELPQCDDRPGSRLVWAIARSKAECVLELLDGSWGSFVPMRPDDTLGSLMPLVAEAYGKSLGTAAEAIRTLDQQDAGSALAGLDRFRILCIESGGTRGALTLNRVVQQWVSLARRFCPIVLVGNAPGYDLYSGDLGVLVREPRELDRSRAYFQGRDGIKIVPESRLPAYENALALSVHRAQGIEADHVLLILPEGPSPALTREAILIALRQARQHITVAGSSDVLCEALERQIGRATGLVDRFLA